MAKYRIFCVGMDLPGDEFEYVDLESSQTLLDADIILFRPSLEEHDTLGTYNGVPLLNDCASYTAMDQMQHWRSEIMSAINSQKLVIVYLSEPDERYRKTKDRVYSVSELDQVGGYAVHYISSFYMIPNIEHFIKKSGTQVELTQNSAWLKPYWNDFSEYHSYEVEVEGDFTDILIKSRPGSKIVGAANRLGSGTLLCLPALRSDWDAFIEVIEVDDRNWSDEALQFGKSYVTALASIADNLKKSSQITPLPEWALDSKYKMAVEDELKDAISKCTAEISKLKSHKVATEENLQEVGKLRRLLFEQGKPLEYAIRDVLEQFGFKAEPFNDGESEFDAVFSSEEGRCIGEAEGKDNKAINVTKFSQLERNIHEDFERDEVEEIAHGVLFGNAFRLSPVEDRGEFFSAKCKTSAKRVKAALVRTPDLFLPAKYLKENPSNTVYAKRCREAIFQAKGEIVEFPEPPVESGVMTIAEISSGDEAADAD